MTYMNSIKSNINILGGYENLTNLPGMLAKSNISAIERTISSNRRYGKAIDEVFLTFRPKQAQRLFMAAMGSSGLSEDAKLRVLALQFYANDYLFRLLFNNCFIPIYKSGRISINRHDVIAFLDEQVRNNDVNVNWTRVTIETLSSKFLTVLKKLGFLDGRVKKTIKGPYTSTDFLIFYHYWLITTDEGNNVFSSSFFPFLMLDREKYQFLMRQPEKKEKLDWHFNGEKFTVQPKMSLDKYVNELSN